MFSEPFLSVAPNSHLDYRSQFTCPSACLPVFVYRNRHTLIGFHAPSYRYHITFCPVYSFASFWSRISVDCSLSTGTRTSSIRVVHLSAYHILHSYIRIQILSNLLPTSPLSPTTTPKKASLPPPLSSSLPPPHPASLVPSREHTKLSLASFAVLRTAHEIPSFPSLACSSRRTVRFFPIAYFPTIIFFFLSLHAHLIAVRTYIHTLLYTRVHYTAVLASCKPKKKKRKKKIIMTRPQIVRAGEFVYICCWSFRDTCCLFQPPS